MYIQLYDNISVKSSWLEVQWDSEKSAYLKKVRGTSFEELLQYPIIGVEDHPRRGHQKILLVACIDYIWLIPFVREGDKLFLKNIVPKPKAYKDIYERAIMKKMNFKK